MSSENVRPGLVIARRYRVIGQLGEGGMGSVFLVEHLHTDERLALKVLHGAIVQGAPMALERFQREARVPSLFASENVCRVTDADVAPELGGVPFLVMEHLRGEDLDQLLSRRGRLAPAEAIPLLVQAARALDKAHAIGVIHRDLKPENLFLTERDDGTPLLKLLDFGIVRHALLHGTGTGAGGVAQDQSADRHLGAGPDRAQAPHGPGDLEGGDADAPDRGDRVRADAGAQRTGRSLRSRVRCVVRGVREPLPGAALPVGR
jgi:serine/threonine protein kinase